MKLFLKKIACFALIGIAPILVLFLLYLHFDPFKVLKPYSNYSYSPVISNRDYITTTTFINNREKYHYNSYIFGSSRTLAFQPDSWQKHLSANDHAFMFDASRESIYGIYTKLKYLDSIKVPIKNALIIVCRDFTFNTTENHEGHLFIKHPATSGESNLSFQLEFLKAYYSPKFLLNFYSYQILGGYRPFMSGYIENRKIAFDTVTNKIDITDQENEITRNPTAYYDKRKDLFYEREGEKTDTVQRIHEKQLLMLREIRRILDKNNSNFRVVISPLYDQIKFHPADMALLTDVFGKNLYDFSGKNSFTNDKTNYYERSHFRPIVGDSILNILYNK